jgi:AcrR family transcriptional regulator
MRKLLSASERLIADGEAFTDISVERLVSEAEISRSTFYVYFEDKADLLRAWYSDVGAELAEAARSWWALGPDATRENLRAAQQLIFDTYGPHAALMAATIDVAGYDPSTREALAEEVRANVEGLRRHIVAGQRGGFIDPDLLAEPTAAWLASMTERGTHQLIRGADREAVARLLDAYTDIVWKTLYAPTRG